MVSRNSENASFVEFFRSVNFSSTTVEYPAQSARHSEFFVPSSNTVSVQETCADDQSLIRSYN